MEEYLAGRKEPLHLMSYFLDICYGGKKKNQRAQATQMLTYHTTRFCSEAQPRQRGLQAGSIMYFEQKRLGPQNLMVFDKAFHP